jgi:hypothetical protein
MMIVVCVAVSCVVCVVCVVVVVVVVVSCVAVCVVVVACHSARCDATCAMCRYKTVTHELQRQNSELEEQRLRLLKQLRVSAEQMSSKVTRRARCTVPTVVRRGYLCHVEIDVEALRL